jgi:uncharacterized protein (TIGR03435 family)
MRAASRILVAVVLFSGALVAAEDSPLAFDVVSIKLGEPGPGRGVPPLFIGESMCNAGRGLRFSCPGVTLRGLVRLAFRTPDTPLLMAQIIGAPDWAATSQFIIDARFVREPTASDIRLQLSMLLRTLIEDRFKLKAHVERRPFPVYALVKARNDGTLGRSIRVATTDCPKLPDDAPPPPRGMPTSSGPRCFLGVFRNGTITSGALTIEGLVRNLNELNMTDRIVVDRTGLTEKFDLDLHWAPDITQPSDDPPLSTALQEQLGLKLEPRTEPMDAVVIESVERPTAN